MTVPTVAFVMDPMERVRPQGDTSFAFMLAAKARGCRILHLTPNGVALDGDQVILHGTELEVADQAEGFYRGLGKLRLPARDCAAIFIRTDPPFDEAYLTTTWLLTFAEKAGVRVINSPRGLREANEHLYALHFVDLCPPQLATAARDDIRAFVRAHGGEAIAKPIDGHGGFGVVCLRQGDSNMAALIDLLTLEGRQPILVQQRLPGGVDGDKRVLLIDGVARGALRRVPPQGDHRGNIHVGGRGELCELDADDRRIAEAMGPRLRADGLSFVGLDIIDGKLIEVNVTSPTLVREIKRLGGPDLAAEVIDTVLKGR